MSRHSKWSKIKHHKGPADVKKGAVFTKLAKNITVAAREGGADANFNFKLRMAIDQARAGNMPKDNVERAIKKGTGELAGEQIETIFYEGFGPGGVAVLVEVLTDNRNRSAATIKHAFSANGGNLASMGAVKWMFQNKGVVIVVRDSPVKDSEELSLIDAGAEDIFSVDGEITIVCASENLQKIKENTDHLGLTVTSAQAEWIAKEKVPWPDGGSKTQLEDLLAALEDDEDVSVVYANVG